MRFKKTTLFFLSFLLALTFCGCDKSQPAKAKPDIMQKTNTVSNGSIGKAPLELDDTQRIGRIMDRMNRALDGHYSVVFCDSAVTADQQIAVDYVLFDRLSDDAVAAMIAESIAKRKLPPAKPSFERQTGIGIASLTGQYVKKAQYDTKGYLEFLNAKRLMFPSNTPEDIADSLRIDAFRRGYESVK